MEAAALRRSPASSAAAGERAAPSRAPGEQALRAVPSRLRPTLFSSLRSSALLLLLALPLPIFLRVKMLTTTKSNDSCAQERGGRHDVRRPLQPRAAQGSPTCRCAEAGASNTCSAGRGASPPPHCSSRFVRTAASMRACVTPSPFPSFLMTRATHFCGTLWFVPPRPATLRATGRLLRQRRSCCIAKKYYQKAVRCGAAASNRGGCSMQQADAAMRPST